MEPDARNRVTDTASRHTGASGATHAGGAPTTDLAESLLPLAISQPGKALTWASEILASSADSRHLSIAHQALAIVHRDRGASDEAVDHGFTALRLARRVDGERQADVLATLGTVLVYAGRTADGLRRLDEAVPLTSPRGLPRLCLRRAHVLALLARNEEALEEVTRAISGCHWAGDALWEGRALNNRFEIHLALGETEAAEADALRAEELLTTIGQDFEAAQALHNRALAALRRDDLPSGLSLLDEVTARYEALGNVRHDLIIDHTHALLSAGLIDESRAMSDRALADTDLAPVRRAELLLASARAALAAGDSVAAEASADQAALLFSAQLRNGWADRARLLRLRAQYVADHPELLPWMPEQHEPPQRSPRARAKRTEALLRESTTLVESMRTHHAAELPVALLMHGRIAHDAGHDSEAQRSLTVAASTRQAGAPLFRAAAWLAQALLAQHRGDRRALYAACRHGLDAVDEHRSSLGDIELRALASGHGIELARLAVSEAVEVCQPRQLLWWSERWRAAALNGSVGRPRDPRLRRDLAALRDVTRRLEDLDVTEASAQTLTRERIRLESSIRHAYRHLRAEASATGQGHADAGLDLEAVFSELGEDGVLLSLVLDRDTLHLLTVTRGRVTHRSVGSVELAEREAGFARFTLRRAAHGRPVDLATAGQRLQHALLGVDAPLPRPRAGARVLRSARGWRPRRVVLVPPADLLTAPWGLLPAFHDVILTVSPSISQWLRALGLRSAAREGHVVLVTGPGLTTREAEVANLRRVHRGAQVLGPEEATVTGAIQALDDASLAHIAAHGRFRADAPLFSALQLADGPLTVHDLQQLSRPPRSIVLSACDSGGAAPIGPHEALGLVSSLLGMGTSDVMASVVPVNDVATLAVMTEVHSTAARGGTLAEGWLAARRAATNDPLLAATAASFTTWGA